LMKYVSSSRERKLRFGEMTLGLSVDYIVKGAPDKIKRHL